MFWSTGLEYILLPIMYSVFNTISIWTFWCYVTFKVLETIVKIYHQESKIPTHTIYLQQYSKKTYWVTICGNTLIWIMTASDSQEITFLFEYLNMSICKQSEKPDMF